MFQKLKASSFSWEMSNSNNISSYIQSVALLWIMGLLLQSNSSLYFYLLDKLIYLFDKKWCSIFVFHKCSMCLNEDFHLNLTSISFHGQAQRSEVSCLNPSLDIDWKWAQAQNCSFETEQSDPSYYLGGIICQLHLNDSNDQHLLNFSIRQQVAFIMLWKNNETFQNCGQYLTSQLHFS